MREREDREEELTKLQGGKKERRKVEAKLRFMEVGKRPLELRYRWSWPAKVNTSFLASRSVIYQVRI
jgi:hypothetical protein